MDVSDPSSVFTFCDEEKITEDFLCQICWCVLNEPVTTSCCQIMFCKKCISPVDKCPICLNNDLNFYPPPKIVTNKINSLKVQCKLCLKVFNNSDSLKHLDICPTLNYSKCSECDFMGSESELQIHIEKCLLIKKFNEEKSFFNIYIETLQEDIESLKKENESLNEYIKTLQEYIKSSENKNKSEENQIKSLKNEIKSLQQEIKRLKTITSNQESSVNLSKKGDSNSSTLLNKKMNPKVIKNLIDKAREERIKKREEILKRRGIQIKKR